jgi:N-acetylneuraminic acid mutarotase
MSRYLKESVALEALWAIRITSGMLEQEMYRQAHESKMPERLQELYVALGNDSVMIQECLARPVIVDRMTRSQFEHDPAIHRAAREKAESLRHELLASEVDPYGDRPDRTVVEVIRIEADTATLEIPERSHSVRRLSPTDFESWRRRLPQTRGEIGPVERERGGFSLRVLFDDEPGRLRFAAYTVPTRSFEEWWRAVESEFDATAVATLAVETKLPNLESRRGPAIFGVASASLDEGTNALESPLAARWGHSAVWTGSEMIVWGGFPIGQGATGVSYDPATDTWRSTTTVGAPSPREIHTAVWTGTEMIVWGGRGEDQGYPTTGGRYDPLTDAWTPTQTVGSPQGRTGHSAFWTGKYMVVWGGFKAKGLKNGGRYDPIADKWRRINTGGAPSSRQGNTAVWTGEEVIVWGGARGLNHVRYLNTGGRYDPDANTWRPTSTVDTPEERSGHTAVWTGEEMIVWGGARDTTGEPGTGGRYDPATDTWRTVALDGAPIARNRPYSAWTGTEMIVWGGIPFLNTGGRYDPLSDRWTPTSTAGAPEGRDGQSAIWAETLLVVWGGDFTNVGGRYDPATDSWTPTSTEIGPD